MGKQKDPEFTFSHESTKITTVCRTTADEKDEEARKDVQP